MGRFRSMEFSECEMKSFDSTSARPDSHLTSVTRAKGPAWKDPNAQMTFLRLHCAVLIRCKAYSHFFFLPILHRCVLRSTNATKNAGVKDTAGDLQCSRTAPHLHPPTFSTAKNAPYASSPVHPTTAPSLPQRPSRNFSPTTQIQRYASTPLPIPSPLLTVRTPDARQRTPESGPSARAVRKTRRADWPALRPPKPKRGAARRCVVSYSRMSDLAETCCTPVPYLTLRSGG